MSSEKAWEKQRPDFIKDLKSLQVVNDPRYGRCKLSQSEADGELYISIERVYQNEERAKRVVGSLEKRISNPILYFVGLVDYQYQSMTHFCSTVHKLRILMPFPVVDLHKELHTRILNEEAFTSEEITHLFYHVVSGLGHMQKLGISHGKFSPAFVASTSTGGYAVMEDPTQEPFESYYGSPSKLGSSSKDIYLSPQAYRALYQGYGVDSGMFTAAKTDVFSAGMVILEAGLCQKVDQVYRENGVFDFCSLDNLFTEFMNRYEGNNVVVTTVQSMLSPQEYDRPDFIEILEKIPSYEKVLEYFAGGNLSNQENESMKRSFDAVTLANMKEAELKALQSQNAGANGGQKGVQERRQIPQQGEDRRLAQPIGDRNNRPIPTPGTQSRRTETGFSNQRSQDKRSQQREKGLLASGVASRTRFSSGCKRDTPQKNIDIQLMSYQSSVQEQQLFQQQQQSNRQDSTGRTAVERRGEYQPMSRAIKHQNPLLSGNNSVDNIHQGLGNSAQKKTANESKMGNGNMQSLSRQSSHKKGIKKANRLRRTPSRKGGRSSHGSDSSLKLMGAANNHNYNQSTPNRKMSNKQYNSAKKAVRTPSRPLSPISRPYVDHPSGVRSTQQRQKTGPPSGRTTGSNQMDHLTPSRNMSLPKLPKPIKSPKVEAGGDPNMNIREINQQQERKQQYQQLGQEFTDDDSDFMESKTVFKPHIESIQQTRDDFGNFNKVQNQHSVNQEVYNDAKLRQQNGQPLPVGQMQYRNQNYAQDNNGRQDMRQNSMKISPFKPENSEQQQNEYGVNPSYQIYNLDSGNNPIPEAYHYSNSPPHQQYYQQKQRSPSSNEYFKTVNLLPPKQELKYHHQGSISNFDQTSPIPNYQQQQQNQQNQYQQQQQQLTHNNLKSEAPLQRLPFASQNQKNNVYLPLKQLQEFSEPSNNARSNSPAPKPSDTKCGYAYLQEQQKNQYSPTSQLRYSSQNRIIHHDIPHRTSTVNKNKSFAVQQPLNPDYYNSHRQNYSTSKKISDQDKENFKNRQNTLHHRSSSYIKYQDNRSSNKKSTPQILEASIKHKGYQNHVGHVRKSFYKLDDPKNPFHEQYLEMQSRYDSTKNVQIYPQTTPKNIDFREIDNQKSQPKNLKPKAVQHDQINPQIRDLSPKPRYMLYENSSKGSNSDHKFTRIQITSSPEASMSESPFNSSSKKKRRSGRDIQYGSRRNRAMSGYGRTLNYDGGNDFDSEDGEEKDGALQDEINPYFPNQRTSKYQVEQAKIEGINSEHVESRFIPNSSQKKLERSGSNSYLQRIPNQRVENQQQEIIAYGQGERDPYNLQQYEQYDQEQQQQQQQEYRSYISGNTSRLQRGSRGPTGRISYQSGIKNNNGQEIGTPNRLNNHTVSSIQGIGRDGRNSSQSKVIISRETYTTPNRQYPNPYQQQESDLRSQMNDKPTPKRYIHSSSKQGSNSQRGGSIQRRTQRSSSKPKITIQNRDSGSKIAPMRKRSSYHHPLSSKDQQGHLRNGSLAQLPHYQPEPSNVYGVKASKDMPTLHNFRNGYNEEKQFQNGTSSSVLTTQYNKNIDNSPYYPNLSYSQRQQQLQQENAYNFNQKPIVINPKSQSYGMLPGVGAGNGFNLNNLDESSPDLIDFQLSKHSDLDLGASVQNQIDQGGLDIPLPQQLDGDVIEKYKQHLLDSRLNNEYDESAYNSFAQLQISNHLQKELISENEGMQDKGRDNQGLGGSGYVPRGY